MQLASDKLDCPVCLEPFSYQAPADKHQPDKRPMIACKYSHTLCADCLQQTTECPRCQAPTPVLKDKLFDMTLISMLPRCYREVGKHVLLGLPDGSRVDAYVLNMYSDIREDTLQEDVRVKTISWWKDVRRVEERLFWKSDISMQVSDKHKTKVNRLAADTDALERIETIKAEQRASKVREFLVGHGNLSAMVVEYIVTGNVSEMDETLRLHHETARLAMAGAGGAGAAGGALVLSVEAVLAGLKSAGVVIPIKGFFALVLSKTVLICCGTGGMFVAGVALLLYAKYYKEVNTIVSSHMKALWDYICKACKSMEKAVMQIPEALQRSLILDHEHSA